MPGTGLNVAWTTSRPTRTEKRRKCEHITSLSHRAVGLWDSILPFPLDPASCFASGALEEDIDLKVRANPSLTSRQTAKDVINPLKNFSLHLL